MKFDAYHISTKIKKNLARMGFRRPTDIQYKAIPSILNGEDVLAVAQTGTGKTAAFAIPVMDKLVRQKKSQKIKGVRCLVMVPTRELGQQIAKVFTSVGLKTKIKVLALHGGVDQAPQIERLSAGVDVLVATPGRMFDLISQKKIILNRVETLVLDEADQMLDLGFIDDITAIKRKLVQRHQTLFFSATINRKIKKLAFSQVRSTAIRIQISPDDPVSKNVSHFVVHVKMDDKRFFLRRFIRDHGQSKMIVFVRTRVRAERVFEALKRQGIAAATLHGEKDQKDRTRVLSDFKKGLNQILIATDVSARGIDIPNVEFVINYDLPEKEENYVHRVGRTGRGTRKGTAVSFCSGREKSLLDSVQSFLNKPVEQLPLSKGKYREIIRLPDEQMSIEQMMQEIESLGKTKPKHKKKR